MTEVISVAPGKFKNVGNHRCQCCEMNPDNDMELVAVWDDPHISHAYNLWQCHYCGAICKENVWKNLGETWLIDRASVDDCANIAERFEERADLSADPKTIGYLSPAQYE